MKKYIVHLWIMGWMTLVGSLCCCAQPTLQDTVTQDTVPEARTLRLLFAGDLMQHTPQIKAALQPDGTYNYEECFARVKPEIEWADVAIANLEVTLAGPPYSGYPTFSAPDDYLRGIRDAGFDVLTTANNHCVDTRRRGLERTIQMMDSLEIPHLGTYRDSLARSESYPYLLEKNGEFEAILKDATTYAITIDAENEKLTIRAANARGGFGEAKQVAGTATGLKTIATAIENGEQVIYNLAGQRVNKATKGIYIINGKKVVIK